MIELEKNSENQEKKLEEKLEKLPKQKKWKIIRLIIGGLCLPFIGPYFPFRRGTLAERMGYEVSSLLFLGLAIAIVPIACYINNNKINAEIYEAEWELETIRRNKLKGESKNE